MTRRKKKQEGFSLVEVLVSLVIVAVLFLAVFALIEQALIMASENKFRMGAIILADQKMEQIRNLPYDSIGIAGGIPSGVLPNSEISNSNNGNYTLTYFVQYIDDSFDGTQGGVPDDLLPTDYKSVRIRVSWLGKLGTKEVNVFTKIAPKGVETDAGGGTLSILVYNADNQPVQSASVHIVNSGVDPAVDFTSETDANGNLTLPGAPASFEGYQITVSKTGYSTSSTTPRTAENPSPTKPNASIFEGQKTEVFFFIDLLSTLTIKTIGQSLPENWRINTDNSGENHTNPRIAMDDNGNIYSVWQDYRHGSDAKIYAQKYNSSGVAQWAEDKVIGSANNQILPDVLVDSSTGSLYIAWNDDSNGNQDCYLVKLATSDGDDIWGGAKKVETGANSSDQSKPRITLSGGNDLTIIWQDNRSSNLDVYTRRYLPDHSTNWNELKINSDVSSADQSFPVVITDSEDNTYVAWTDERNGNQDIYAQKLDSAGTSLWAGDLLINSDVGTSNQYSPNITIDTSDSPYIVWTDERNGNRDIYAQKLSTSTGAKLWINDMLINSDGGSTHQYSPDIAINSLDNVYVAWTDERNGNQDIYAQKLDTSGNRQWTEDVRININTGTSGQTNPGLTINPVDNKPYAAWQDDRNGASDIYATTFDVYGASSSIANVPITITGAKRIGESPVIYKYTADYTTNASGIATIPNLEWDTYTITLRTGYVDHTILLTTPTVPYYLAPNSLQEVILNLD